MAFKAYLALKRPDGTWLLGQASPVRFSGPHGLVALWCREHAAQIEAPWRVVPEAFLELLFPPAEARDRWVVLEQDDGETCIYSRLLSISGVATRRVEMLFSFAPLQLVHGEPALCVRPDAGLRVWSEELALDGGPGSACTWRWCRPHLALGATVLRPART